MNQRHSEAGAPCISRRGFVEGVAAAAGLFVLGGVSAGVPDGEFSGLRPPGAADAGSFSALCLRCDRCRGACPQDCVSILGIERGFVNWRTPTLDFRKGACDFCGKCVDVCATGALHAWTADALPIIGCAEIDEGTCIAFLSSACRVCADACPYGAISLSESGLPVVDETLCNGCGICENVCPSTSLRSYSGAGSRGVSVVSRKEAKR